MITVTLAKINGATQTTDVRAISTADIVSGSMRPLTANTTSSACVFKIQQTDGNGLPIIQEWQVSETYAQVEAALTADNQGVGVVPSYGASTGTDTYAVVLSPAWASLVENVPFLVKFGITNTGASTLAVNGLAAKPIRKGVGAVTALSASDLVVTKIYTLIYDGTNFQINL